ncbi:MAG: segregation/condensation protein A [Mollicutes bacterium]|nr:segregation/condensation protein A [Mollicutes bacterium]
MEYRIKINEFEGPLDLLLHLIKESDIDIYDIKISEITKQYLDYIKAMEEMNLSIASEYLVMASELIELKSKMLLPKNEEEFEDDYESPEETLIRKLLDYKNYKDITKTFKELEQERFNFYTKLPSNIDEYQDEDNICESRDISLLLDAFAKFIERSEEQKPLHTKITTKEISLKDRIDSIRKILKTKKRIIFTELFEQTNKEYLIVTFLSILQMAKDQELEIEQEDLYQDIFIKLKE